MSRCITCEALRFGHLGSARKGAEVRRIRRLFEVGADKRTNEELYHSSRALAPSRVIRRIHAVDSSRQLTTAPCTARLHARRTPSRHRHHCARARDSAHRTQSTANAFARHRVLVESAPVVAGESDLFHRQQWAFRKSAHRQLSARHWNARLDELLGEHQQRNYWRIG